MSLQQSTHNATTYFGQIIVFLLELVRIFAESYVKLQYFVTILSLVTLQHNVYARQVKSIVLTYTVQH